MKERAKWFVIGLIVVLSALAPAVYARETLQVYLTPKEQPYLDYLREIAIPEFEELYPEIAVELIQGEWSPDGVITRYIAGSPPDVVQISSLIGVYAPMLAPLDNYVRGWEDLADFPPGMIENVSIEGRLYAIPWSLGIRPFLYRKDRFAEAGMDPEVPPATWDELLSYGRKLTVTDHDGKVVQAGFKSGSHEIDVSPFLLQAGNRIMSDDLARATFAAPEAIEAVDFVRSLYFEYRIAAHDVPGFSKGGAMMEYASFSPGDTAHYRDEDIGVGMPLAHHEQTILGVHYSWAIINTSPRQDVAWKWIEFISGREHMLGLGQLMGADLFPPRMSVISEPPWSTDPRWRTIFDSMAISTGVPFQSPHFEALRSQFLRPALRRIIDQGEPASILVDVAQRANAWLAEQLNL